MNANLNAEIINAISILQNSPEMISMLIDTENFLIEKCDDESLLQEAHVNLKGIRMIRRLLEQIV